MDGLRVVYNIPFIGTMSGAHTFAFSVPCGMTFVHASAIASTAAVGTFDVGPAVDPNGWIAAGTLGASFAASAFVTKDFNGALCDQISPPHVAKDTVIEVTLSSSSQIDACIALTFEEG